MAFRKLEQVYSMPVTPIKRLPGTMCQHDFDGRRIFQHRNLVKWKLCGNNPRIPDFWFEDQCREFVDQLRDKWDGQIRNNAVPARSPDVPAVALTRAANVTKRKSNSGKPNFTKSVVFRGPVNSYTGYGLHACQIISDLAGMGYTVRVRPTELEEKFAKIPMGIKRRFVDSAQPEDWELMLHPPNFPPTPGKRTVYFTMWEASRLPSQWVEWLNEAECIIVPCQWNAVCFSASGVERPIRVIPLGVKSDIFRFREMTMEGPCVFGTAGRMNGGGERKGLNEAIELFQAAFPKP